MTEPATLYFDTAQTALDCICAQMDELREADDTYEGCPCLVYVSAGEPDIDCCEDAQCDSGMLAVHIENVYPSDAFPDRTASFEPCKAQTWVAELVVTVARCAAVMDEQGTPASGEQRTASGRQMAMDKWAVLTALSCCLADDAPPGKRRRRVLIGESRSLRDEGGCAAIEVRAFVETGQVCGCSSGS